MQPFPSSVISFRTVSSTQNRYCPTDDRDLCRDINKSVSSYTVVNQEFSSSITASNWFDFHSHQPAVSSPIKFPEVAITQNRPWRYSHYQTEWDHHVHR